MGQFANGRNMKIPMTKIRIFWHFAKNRQKSSILSGVFWPFFQKIEKKHVVSAKFRPRFLPVVEHHRPVFNGRNSTFFRKKTHLFQKNAKKRGPKTGSRSRILGGSPNFFRPPKIVKFWSLKMLSVKSKNPGFWRLFWSIDRQLFTIFKNF